MKSKEDASKAKSDEYLAFEALAKRIITNNKPDTNSKNAVLEQKKLDKEKQKASKH